MASSSIRLANTKKRYLKVFQYVSTGSTSWLAYVKALERMLLAGVAGAFFFAKSIPLDAREFSWSPDWEYTLDRSLRYLSAAWFLAYVFVSAVNNDRSNEKRAPKEIGFDVLQSMLVVAAVYALGFVDRFHGFGFDAGLSAFRFSSGVVLAVSLLSLKLFRSDTCLDPVREAGALVAAVTLFISFCFNRSLWVLLLLLVGQVVLWFVWLAFLLIRVETPCSPAAVNVASKAKCHF